MKSSKQAILDFLILLNLTDFLTKTIGIIATTMAVKLKSVYKLFHMAGDIVYNLLFPQLTAAMYMPKHVNWVGSLCAFFAGTMLRFLR